MRLERVSAEVLNFGFYIIFVLNFTEWYEI